MKLDLSTHIYLYIDTCTYISCDDWIMQKHAHAINFYILYIDYIYCVYFIYTAVPDMISNVIIDLDTVNIDNDNVSFIFNWNEPFANFDPIVNYTVTINCTDNATCPVIVNTDNVTRTANVNFITDLTMMTPLSVTATNTIGTSDTAIRIIAGKLHMYIRT